MTTKKYNPDWSKPEVRKHFNQMRQKNEKTLKHADTQRKYLPQTTPLLRLHEDFLKNLTPEMQLRAEPLGIHSASAEDLKSEEYVYPVCMKREMLIYRFRENGKIQNVRFYVSPEKFLELHQRLTKYSLDCYLRRRLPASRNSAE